MRLKKDVKSVEELERNASDLVREVAEQGRTGAIVQDGKARAVLMDVESYNRMRSAVALLKIIAQGESRYRRRTPHQPGGGVRPGHSRH